MNLGEIREKFVEVSGRYDLVEDTVNYNNATSGVGADYFIQAGQRYLDRGLDNRMAVAEVVDTLSLGSYTFDFPLVRGILGVHVLHDEKWVPLQRLSYGDFLERWDKFSEVDDGTPSTWAIEFERGGDSSSIDDGDATTESTIYVMPPPDEDVSVKVLVRYSNDELSDDADTNWWSVAYPDLLVNAAQYALEVAYRNRSGQEDFRLPIELMLESIDHDNAEEDSSGELSMRDSW